MNNTMNTTMNGTLYLLEDATTGTIVTIKTTIEALVEAFGHYSSEHFGARCGFYKLADGKLLEVEDNELPEEFLCVYYDECEEYDDCAYCPVCIW